MITQGTALTHTVPTESSGATSSNRNQSNCPALEGATSSSGQAESSRVLHAEQNLERNGKRRDDRDQDPTPTPGPDEGQIGLQGEFLHLIMLDRKYGKMQCVIDITNLKTDYEVFIELNSVYRQHRGRWRALTTLKKLRLTKVRRL